MAHNSCTRVRDDQRIEGIKLTTKVIAQNIELGNPEAAFFMRDIRSVEDRIIKDIYYLECYESRFLGRKASSIFVSHVNERLKDVDFMLKVGKRSRVTND